MTADWIYPNNSQCHPELEAKDLEVESEWRIILLLKEEQAA
jgi:hypothetical protein